MPLYLHNKFRNVIQQVKSKNEFVSFKHFDEFMKNEAKKGNDPVYGKVALATQHNENLHKKLNSNFNPHI